MNRRSETTEAGEVSPLLNPKARIDVRDFAPVAEASVALRPFTVFVGPSNTGKTYLAILIYALHRVFGGFPRLPPFRMASRSEPGGLHRNEFARLSFGETWSRRILRRATPCRRFSTG